MKRKRKFSDTLLILSRRIPDRQLMIVLSVVVGFLAGMVAVVMKNLVFIIKKLLTGGFEIDYSNYLYVVYPAIGILLVMLFIKFILRRPVRDGIPNVLYSISRNHGIIKPHNTFSSIITSTITVGFGGSVGLEGPTVVTGAAIGSVIAKKLGLNYKQVVAVLGFASAAAMSAIFKAPIAAIVFALEVILFDMTMSSLVPLLLASIVAAITSYAFLGQDVLYPFQVVYRFTLSDTIYYFALGVFCAMISVYYIKGYVLSGRIFDKIPGWLTKLLVGASLLGFLIFLMPALYGEGYEAINTALKGNLSFIFDNSIFYGLRSNQAVALVLLLAIILLKVVATSLTFRAGGIGGVFAPTLFIGTMTGLFFAKSMNFFGMASLPVSDFALVGMAGLLAGVVHAPLTAIFLIAEITGGYSLIFPIMIVATTSYGLTRIFSSRSIYTIQLSGHGDMLTHHKDRALLSMMSIKTLIETNFKTVHPEGNLGDLIKVVAESTRNIFPVVDEENNFYGIIVMDQIRHLMFHPEMYEKVSVRSLMFHPSTIVELSDDMETVAGKFQHSGKYNLVVLDKGKYVGFVSRANVFSHYRQLLKEFSED
ncbi:chloride channel protein [Candidatus Sulfidibacterium hydrothermale]|uniref:chloride channel protein n=1 Tax=Candidatus Sulfidibacterium hydrothermale TaxID=2875962 RepID=UPI001F0A2858|nr:chloride channel protein [Candidatus Sulfidibacterium hydrothermale]UBM62655.1 chloride channel protein [Candidatus Sulfidibacterium hydrothermale]